MYFSRYFYITFQNMYLLSAIISIVYNTIAFVKGALMYIYLCVFFIFLFLSRVVNNMKTIIDLSVPATIVIFN